MGNPGGGALAGPFIEKDNEAGALVGAWRGWKGPAGRGHQRPRWRGGKCGSTLTRNNRAAATLSLGNSGLPS